MKEMASAGEDSLVEIGDGFKTLAKVFSRLLKIILERFSPFGVGRKTKFSTDSMRAACYGNSYGKQD
jgi:hypothetical protein